MPACARVHRGISVSKAKDKLILNHRLGDGLMLKNTLAPTHIIHDFAARTDALAGAVVHNVCCDSKHLLGAPLTASGTDFCINA